MWRRVIANLNSHSVKYGFKVVDIFGVGALTDHLIIYEANMPIPLPREVVQHLRSFTIILDFVGAGSTNVDMYLRTFVRDEKGEFKPIEQSTMKKFRIIFQSIDECVVSTFGLTE